MRQVLFTIPIFGGVKVFGYGAMLVVAFISSTWLAYWRARRERLDPEVIGDMSFWVFLFGLIGARLFYCVEYLGRGYQDPLGRVQYWKGGVVYYGGIVGGVAAFFFYWRLRPFPMRPYMDVLAPSIAVGTLFGRLGCFLERLLLRRRVPASLGGLVSDEFASLGPALQPWAHSRRMLSIRCRSTPPRSTRRSTRSCSSFC